MLFHIKTFLQYNKIFDIVFFFGKSINTRIINLEQVKSEHLAHMRFSLTDNKGKNYSEKTVQHFWRITNRIKLGII